MSAVYEDPKPHNAHLAIAELIGKLQEQGEPAADIVDALLFMGAIVLGDNFDRRVVDTIIAVTATVAHDPNTPTANAARRWMRPAS